MNEKILKYELPQHTIDNIMLFLKRTPLTGEEAIAWVEIVQKLNNPINGNEKLESTEKEW
jgi:hypothetical protein